MRFLKELWYFIFSLEFIKQIIIAITIILSLILICAIVLRTFTHHGEFIIVPDIINSDYKTSSKTLLSKDLKYSVNFIYRPNVNPGIILEQNPAALTKVKPGQMIYLTVSSQDIPLSKFPSIEGLSIYEASNILQNDNISIDSVEYAPDIEKNIVLKAKYNNELIKPGTLIPMFASVTLILGDGFGSNELAVPNIVGLTLKEAIFALRGYGLLLGKVINDNTDSQLELEKLKIYKQYPPSNQGITIRQGDKIDIYLQ